MFMVMSIIVPVSDVEEIDRLRKLKKLSRLEYIREALEYYNENPTPPLYTIRGSGPYKGKPTRPITLLLDQVHVDIINLCQDKFFATKVQIIRQALIEKAHHDGETFKVAEYPPINPKWEGKWVKASAVYTLLGMHRNILYRTVKSQKLDIHQGLKNSRYPDQWYRLTDIIRLYRLDEVQIEALDELGGLKDRPLPPV